MQEVYKDGAGGQEGFRKASKSKGSGVLSIVVPQLEARTRCLGIQQWHS